eukprot:TRINITY_DN9016_c0_g1_i1.p1 TRINITY_DN9016_c0_g1~~TRINITY_DN9016_c0_g1_i1.p1  ORF type:complete len:382 (-),score=46.37 TRINITY_DN9016_c0_g1_i1:344-1489(-)
MFQIVIWCSILSLGNAKNESRRKLKLTDPESIRLSTQEFNPSELPTQTTAAKSSFNPTICDDISPSPDFECSIYEQSGQCGVLQKYFCRRTCGRCCTDEPMPGTTSCEQASATFCADERFENFCRKTCGHCDDGSPGVATEAEALQIFHAQLKGTNFSWLGTDPCDDWTGVSCNQQGSVRRVDISKRGISGTVSPELSILKDLEVFSILENKFTGTLPVELSTWRKVVYFYFHTNQFTGTLPSEYSTFDNVEFFAVSINPSLGGALPVEYSAWKKLKNNWFNQAAFTGTLHPEYSAWEDLRWGLFHRSQYSGTIPLEYSTWTKSTQIRFHDNSFSGVVPNYFSGFTDLGYISVFSQEGDGLCAEAAIIPFLNDKPEDIIEC